MSDVSIDRSQALAAVERLGPRAADIVAAIGDPRVPTRGLRWTLGETAAHLVVDLRHHRAWLRGEGKLDYGAPNLAEENLRGIAELGEGDPATLSAILREENAALVREAAEQPAGATFPAEVGPSLSVEVMMCIHLGELLVHGFDIARTLNRPWPVDRSHANLVALGALAVLPQFVDPGAARGARVSYELRLRHGLRAVIRIEDGAITVAPPAPGVPVDCRISADPAAFLLVAYGRVGQWGPILRGRMLAWGRKPWAAMRLTTYIRNP